MMHKLFTRTNPLTDEAVKLLVSCLPPKARQDLLHDFAENTIPARDLPLFRDTLALTVVVHRETGLDGEFLYDCVSTETRIWAGTKLTLGQYMQVRKNGPVDRPNGKIVDKIYSITDKVGYTR
jgi:hypothetical protein